MSRKLATEEQALWARVAATVKPLRPRPAPDQPPPGRKAPVPVTRPPSAASTSPVPGPRSQNANTLDGGWDRRLAAGLVRPDMVVDLHGLNLAAAHGLLEARLAEAAANGDRLLLLVTGKPPHSDRRPEGRGAIRASVADWLAASAHASDIAAVRAAHRRHGGAGALYIILRRRRDRHRQNS